MNHLERAQDDTSDGSSLRLSPISSVIDVTVGTSSDDEADVSLTTLLKNVGPVSSPAPETCSVRSFACLTLTTLPGVYAVTMVDFTVQLVS